MSITGQEKSRTLRKSRTPWSKPVILKLEDAMNVKATVKVFTYNTGTMVTTFINDMPSTDINAVHDGYLLYDLDTELFAGGSRGWIEHEGRLLIHGNHIYVPWEEDVPWRDRQHPHPVLNDPIILSLLDKGNEVVLVPCKSYESIVGEVLFVYQEFDWQWAFGIKSRSGKLPVKYS